MPHIQDPTCKKKQPFDMTWLFFDIRKNKQKVVPLKLLKTIKFESGKSKCWNKKGCN